MTTALQQPKTGDQAPKFSLPAFPSGNVSLDEFAGKKNVILAFYPKDDTPGCTKEMCAFSEDLSQFNDANTVVLGISCDNESSHEKFAAKFNLKQTLLADHTGETAKNYGVLPEGKNTASRVLFVIDKNGVVQHVQDGIPENAKLLEIVRNLK
jgi:peroxiredoxin Q/BCP